MLITAKSYFMDDPREAKRLADKVDAGAWVRRYVSPNLRTETRVLDVGCGPGHLASAIGRAHASAKIIGVDISPQRFSGQIGNVPENVVLGAGDAHALPFQTGCFGFCFCRFVLEYVLGKQTAVRELVRVCEPGGYVLLQDLDGQLVWHYPEVEGLRVDIERVLAVLAKTGFDPFVGRKLYFLARSAGLTGIDVQVEGYHRFAGAIDDQNLALWEMKLEIALPAITMALGSADAARSLKFRFLEYLKRDDTLTYSVLFTVTGRKPPLSPC